MLRFLFLLILLAVAVYLLVRVMQDRGLVPDQEQRRRERDQQRRRRAEPPRVVGPDDDEDFLRDLDRRRLNPEDPES